MLKMTQMWNPGPVSVDWTFDCWYRYIITTTCMRVQVKGNGHLCKWKK